MQPSPNAPTDVLSLARAVLHAYAARSEPAPEVLDADAGPAVLTRLMLELGALDDEVADRVLARWVLTQQSQLSGHPGLYGGLAGLWAGARLAARHRPRLGSLVAPLGEVLATYADGGAWQTARVAWHDYDLVSGPAGVVLAATIDAPTPADAHGRAAARSAARHLAALCPDATLAPLRVASYADDELRAWNHGRINLGLAHGVGGVVAGLTAALRHEPSPEPNHTTHTPEPNHTTSAAPELRAALHHAAGALAREAYVDAHGLSTWPPAASEGAAPPSRPSRRQAWCYGTPGLAWVLWDAGCVLGAAALVAQAEDAMRSYCAAFDEARYLDREPLADALGVCHGAAGILAIADAFALHARLPPAAALAARLERHILERLDQVHELAATNATLLTGASGVVATLLLRRGGSRAWLRTLALR